MLTRPNSIMKMLGMGVVGFLLAAGTVWGQTRPLLELPPSNLTPGAISKGVVNFFCYDVDGIKLINCTVTARLSPLDQAFGGHINHIARQPVGTIRDANTPGAGGEFLIGSTLNGFTVIYEAPAASGRVEFDTTWTFPPRYLCLDNSQRTCSFTDHFDVFLPLQRLDPEESPVYKVFRPKDVVKHPQGTSGTPDALNKLKILSALYFIKSNQGRRLSINDISLPKGGLFDYLNDWTPPHAEHRLGTQVDLNRAGFDQQGNPLPELNCPDDLALHEALDWLIVGGFSAELWCETKGKKDPTGPNKHINF